MSELLSERQDLVELYFTSTCFDYEKYERLIDELNCEGECSHRNYQFNDYVDKIGISSSRKRLAYLLPEQISFLTDFFNANNFFSKKLTLEDTENLFACNLDEPLQALNNSRMAMFLFCLRDQYILAHNWQKLIQDYKLISSSSTGLPLKCHNLGNALSEFRKSHGGPDPLFVQAAKTLKEMKE